MLYEVITHHGDRAGPGDHARGHEVGGRRHEPDGPEARHRQGRNFFSPKAQQVGSGHLAVDEIKLPFSKQPDKM